MFNSFMCGLKVHAMYRVYPLIVQAMYRVYHWAFSVACVIAFFCSLGLSDKIDGVKEFMMMFMLPVKQPRAAQEKPGVTAKR